MVLTRESLCFQLSRLLSSQPPHTRQYTLLMICAPRQTVVQARQCTCTILYRCGHRQNVEVFEACNRYHQNFNFSVWSLTKFERQSKYSFHNFRDGFQLKEKCVQFHVAVKQRTCLLWIQLLNCRKLLK